MEACEGVLVGITDTECHVYRCERDGLLLTHVSKYEWVGQAAFAVAGFVLYMCRSGPQDLEARCVDAQSGSTVWILSATRILLVLPQAALVLLENKPASCILGVCLRSGQVLFQCPAKSVRQEMTVPYGWSLNLEVDNNRLTLL